MKKRIWLILKILLVLLFISYLGVCAYLYFYQEKLIFLPEKITDKNFKFTFKKNFEEIDIKTTDNIELNGLLFKVKKPKGLVFFLHGNSGSLKRWGNEIELYNKLNYDVFVLDYRSYGKSGGAITNEEQLFNDVQIAYDKMKQRYQEKDIVVLGFSLGTGFATKIAADNKPKQLILHAPYLSLVEMMKYDYPIIPTSILKYKFETNKYIQKCTVPVAIFHGNKDEVIPYKQSLELKKLLKKSDRLIILDNQGHSGIPYNSVYIKEITKILN